MSDTDIRSRARTTGRARRIFTALTGLVFVGVLLQGLSGSGLLAHLGHPWAVVHDIAATGVAVLALACPAVALVGQGLTHRLVVWSAVLAGLIVAQIMLGLALGQGHHALLVVHVPVALLTMALSTVLCAATARGHA